MTGFLAILVTGIIIYLINLKNELDIKNSNNKDFQKKIESQINNILKRLKKLETDTVQSVQAPEKKENINIKTQQIQDISKQVEEIQNSVEKKIPSTSVQQHNIEQSAPYIKETTNSNNSGSFDLENIFLGNIFSKIGGIALVVAICFLVKLTSQYIEFTPVIKISLGYIASIGLLLYSLFLYKKETAIIPEITSGVSISGLLLSTYFACFFYNLFPIPVALFIAFIIALTSYFISEKFHSFSTIAIGLFGGYLNPAVFSDNMSLPVMFGYLIALNLISASYTYKNGSKNLINCINILLTVITLVLFSSKGTVLIAYPLALWLLYVAYDILTTLREVKQSDSIILRWFNFAALVYITNHIFNYSDKIPIGLTIFVIGIIYGILYFIFRTRNEEMKLTNLQSGLISLFIGTFYVVNADYLALAWTVEGFLVSEIYLKLNKPFLRHYTFLFFLPAFICLLLNYQSMFIIEEPNTLLKTFGLYLAQSAIMIYSAKRVEVIDSYTKNNLFMLGFSILYLYAIFWLNIGNTHIGTKLYIDAIIACIYSLHSYKLLSKDYKDFSLIFSECLYCLALILLAIAEGFLFIANNFDYIPFFNIEFLTYLTILALTIYYHKTLNPIFGYISIVIGLFSLVGQTNYLFEPMFPEGTMPLVMTITLMIYSGIVLTIGILKNITFMKQTSICLILILLGKLLLVDLSDIDAIFKLIAFVIIGIILLGVSYYYQKNKTENKN